jgi:hypothetical protein
MRYPRKTVFPWKINAPTGSYRYSGGMCVKKSSILTQCGLVEDTQVLLKAKPINAVIDVMHLASVTRQYLLVVYKKDFPSPLLLFGITGYVYILVAGEHLFLALHRSNLLTNSAVIS